MTITSQYLSDLLKYFSVENSSNHILSLALTANNSFSVTPPKQQTVIFERPSWELRDAENSSTSLLFYQYIDNSSSIYYLTNDTFSNRSRGGIMPRITTEIPIWLIPCYSIILIFAIVGNLLVASTLFQNRRMRTITNVFLVNLAISDMLLGVLCMPITLVGTYLRHFIFGEFVCKFIQFAQAASVAVSSWTLVAISCERYYAICHPLRSRTWQTLNHAYKIIGCIWVGSIICMAPIAIFSQLIPTSRQGLRKCREQWPEEAVGYERSYNIFLDLALLVLPLAILCVAYILITRTLYIGIKNEKALIFANKNNNIRNSIVADGKIYTQVMPETKTPTVYHLNMSLRSQAPKSSTNSTAGCRSVNNVNNAFQVGKSVARTGRQIKHLSGSGVINKYSAMNLISVPEAGHNHCGRELCYNSPGSIKAITANAIKESKEQMPTSFQLKSNDDTILTGIDKKIKTEPANASTSATTIKTNISPTLEHQLTTSSLDEKCSQYCYKRSASVQSLNHNIIPAGDHKQDVDNRFGQISSNTIPKLHLSRSRCKHQKQLQIKQHHHHKQQQQQQQDEEDVSEFSPQQETIEISENRKLNATRNLRITESTLRRSNLTKNLESKKRVVKMLFVLVLEFFICWTPLYIINTMVMFIGPAIYEYVDYTTISFFQLLAYSSSCCNPITYCFMNSSFRRAFFDTFRGIHLNSNKFWYKNSKDETKFSGLGNSITFANSRTVVTANTVLDSPRL